MYLPRASVATAPRCQCGERYYGQGRNSRCAAVYPAFRAKARWHLVIYPAAASVSWIFRLGIFSIFLHPGASLRGRNDHEPVHPGRSDHISPRPADTTFPSLRPARVLLPGRTRPGLPGGLGARRSRQSPLVYTLLIQGPGATIGRLPGRCLTSDAMCLLPTTSWR